MSRSTQLTKSKIAILAGVLIIIVAGAGIDVAAHHQTSTKTVTVTQQAPTTHLAYRGQDGKTALALLKQHATVVTKSSSLGEYVVSINGNNGGGSKYWIFYVNGQESQVGADAYTTKNTDLVQWKLQ